MTKPNCYACRYRRNLPGDTHSSCVHPATGNTGDNMLVGIVMMLNDFQAGKPPAGSRELGITANPHGVRSGWFYWPYNYDPTWLLTCNGFTAIEAKPADTQATAANTPA